jgi:uncharacterized protein (DUF2237 family)
MQRMPRLPRFFVPDLPVHVIQDGNDRAPIFGGRDFAYNCTREAILPMPYDDKNVLGGVLAPCSTSPRTGFYRDGCCNTGPEDLGLHIVCAQVTAEFLAFARAHGNDLVTPAPEFGFPGLKPGDRWCVCAATWREAFEAGVASPVVLAATHEETLAVIPLQALKQHALDVH